MAKIGAKNILVQLSDKDSADPSLKDRVQKFAAERKIESVIITVDGKLMLSSKTMMTLNSGVSTLRNALELHSLPERLSEYVNLPRDFIVKYFNDGYDESKICYSIGVKFTEEIITLLIDEEKKASQIEKSREKNRNILAKDVETLVEEGALSVADAPRTQYGKDFLEKRKNDKCLNKDLDGVETMTFQEYDDEKKQPVKNSKFPPTNVEILGRPGQIGGEKKKHYYIYSRLSNFGKTYNLERFCEKYNGYIISDPSNWTDTPSGIQFMVFEEVDNTHNKLDFANLKSLTGGTTGGFKGNRKSFGPSFRPRKDVQVVLLSNKSPYEVYSQWNANMQRSFMSSERMDHFDKRFKVIRLDGSVEEDRKNALEPEHVDVVALNEDQFLEICERVFEGVYKMLTEDRTIPNKVHDIERGVDKIVNWSRKREPGYYEEHSAYLLIVTVLKGFDDGRFSPTLTDTFKTLYENAFEKKKGRGLETARGKLVCQETANETKAFGSRRLEDLAKYLDKNPTAIYRLRRFYADEPHSIDFSQTDDKEGVFRACLEVHSYNIAKDGIDEVLYRSVVFDKVWKVANPEHEDGENVANFEHKDGENVANPEHEDGENEGQSVSRKRKRSSSSEFSSDEGNE